jgi:hypothetical protein
MEEVLRDNLEDLQKFVDGLSLFDLHILEETVFGTVDGMHNLLILHLPQGLALEFLELLAQLIDDL